MDQDDGHLYDLSQPLQQQLRLTARVALLISIFATLALMLTLYFLFRGQQQDSYLHIIQSLTRSHDQLLNGMLIGGMSIILVAGLITWSIMLYSSARIAGPLYRFSRNIEMEINEGPVATVQLRKGDHLQALSNKLSDAVTGLDRYYAEQVEVIERLEQQLSSERSSGSTEYDGLLRRLNRVVKRESA